MEQTLIKDVRVYDRALTLEEIRRAHQNPGRLLGDGLVLAWVGGEVWTKESVMDGTD